MSATPAQNHEILYRLGQGESCRTIAAVVGVSRCTVSNRRRHYFPDGIRRRDPVDGPKAGRGRAIFRTHVVPSCLLRSTVDASTE